MIWFTDVGAKIKEEVICIKCNPKVECECGAKISKNSIYRHTSTRKHLIYIERNHIYNRPMFRMLDLR